MAFIDLSFSVFVILFGYGVMLSLLGFEWDRILIVNCRLGGVKLGYMTTGNMTFGSLLIFS